MIGELQSRLDEALDKIKVAYNHKKDLIKFIEERGFDVINGQVVKREEVYGAFWDLTYYSHFDGHNSSAVYQDTKGAIEVSEDDFNKLKHCIKEYQNLPQPIFGQGNDIEEKKKKT
jgi:hypothetical protein